MNRSKLLKIIILSIITLITVFGIGMYKNYLGYIDNLNQDQKKLIKYYKSYSYDYYDVVPKNKSDFENMLKWARFTSGESDLKLNFLECGYDVHYDSIQKSSIIYSFGKDKEDNRLISNYEDTVLDSIGQFEIKNKISFDFFFDYFKNKDIPLLKIYEFDFPCNLTISKLDKEPNYNFQLYKQEKNLWENKDYRLKFLRLLGNFERQHLDESSVNNFENTSVFVKYKKGSIEVICNNGFNQNQVRLIEKKLYLFFVTLNKEKVFFDYALFSIRVGQV